MSTLEEKIAVFKASNLKHRRDYMNAIREMRLLALDPTKQKQWRAHRRQARDEFKQGLRSQKPLRDEIAQMIREMRGGRGIV